ncbi:hypothetical protein [Thiomicrorhabdus sp. Kp2]|uniref:hypothetical protein n=1 Tax=Thiomicrorhabdus sp. Kp2 TaxID=1123518 RepID=UPI0003FAA818|nr:hypothetical protein [Thiomicrorhabdus sp. Kp2]
MKIIDQNLQLSSQHYAAKESHRERVHETFVNGQLATRETDNLSVKNTSSSQHQLLIGKGVDSNMVNNRPSIDSRPSLNQINDQQKNLVYNPNSPSQFVTANDVKTSELDNQSTLPPKLLEMIKAIEALMERITGKAYTLKVMGYESQDKPEKENINPGQMLSTPSENQIDLQQNSIPSMGERWSLHSSYQETEQTHFQAKGHVKTADGREIDFALKTQMYRNFSTQLHVEKEQGVVLKDPLVVNFSGAPANLTVEKFNFDLDADGKNEQISFVNQDSGFLAYDKNQDGVINNGSELFGALTGNGFEELSQFDDDNNGWIDENDAIFSKLQIWQKDSHGLDQLSGLMEMNIGAISLNHIATEFALKDENNQQHGQITDTGVYLRESGGVGTIQQIDLVV